MIQKIAIWILKKLDLDIDLIKDVLTITVRLAGVKIFTWTKDIIKDDKGEKLRDSSIHTFVGALHGKE